MVNVIVGNDDEYFQSRLSKRFFCFGAGKKFHEFLYQYPNIFIEGVIDNYRDGDTEKLIVHGRLFPIISLNDYRRKNVKDSLLIITVKDYEKIIEQLDADDRLDGTECYLPAILSKNEHSTLVEWARKHNRGKLEDKYFASRNQREILKRFQIWDCLADGFNAGSKAPMDVMNIAGQNGYQRIDIHPWHGEDIHSAVPWSRSRNTGDWEKCYHEISDRAIVLLQHPFWQMQPERNKVLRRLKDEKKIRIVSFVHDVEELRRAYYTDEMRREFHFMLEIADVFIVHSETMKQFLVGKGVKPFHVLVLGIFDYLTKHAEIPHREYEKSVVIAGNLASGKGRYIEHLNELPEVPFHLFGSGYHPSKTGSNVKYHGAFPAEKLVESLVGDFGLVWNGDSMETCDGDMGNYLRYNSPHKLSLYIAAGIPPIVWKESAAAAFVREHGIGLEISSLYELAEAIGGVTLEQYREVISQIRPLSLALRQGAFTRAALERAEMVVSRISEESGVSSV